MFPATAVAPTTAVMSSAAAASRKATPPHSPVPAAKNGHSRAAAAAGAVYGVSDPALLSESPAVQIQQLQAMRSVGLTSVRIDASWAVGQPDNAQSFNWPPLDQAIASIQQVGMSVDLTIDQTPQWAAVPAAGGNPWAEPADPNAYAAWAAAVAARYGPMGVQYYEIWNEENTSNFWAPNPDPDAYTVLLKAAYAAIKQADPNAVVISGGLAPAGNTGTSFDPRTFLERMYADGAHGSMDGVGDHPYCFPALPNEVQSWSGWSQMSQTSPSMRSIMNDNGDSGKKIWITEYGAPSTGPNSVGVSGESAELSEAIAIVKKVNWVGSFYIYTWADVASLPADEVGFGLLGQDLSQKPAFTAVADSLPQSERSS